MERISQLLNANDETTWQHSWRDFLFNVEAVQELTSTIDAATAHELISKEVRWNGQGWTTSRCSRVLWELTNVALVSFDFNKYKMAFLYSLALLWDIDVNTLELDTEPAQAAFMLHQVYQGVVVPVPRGRAAMDLENPAAESRR